MNRRDRLINLNNKEVIHKTFGKGNVVNYDDSYISINFESGDKKFVFPDVFKDHVTFVDQKATNSVKKKLEKKEEELEKQALILKEEQELKREQQYLWEQQQNIKNRKIHPKTQSVFWANEEDEETIFKDWRVFTGEIKSGKSQGEPRKLVRMSENSACLITKRDDDLPEKERKILGFFMADESFNGRECEDGYIIAHPEYRIQLSKEESDKMYFWTYYMDEKTPNETIWNSGRQRYFDNIWMAQILNDLVSLRDEAENKEEAQAFFEYFCKMNHISKIEISEPIGPLTKI